MNRIGDEPAKIRFLEDATGERSSAASWAVEELCNRGSYQSLPFIRKHIRQAYSLKQDLEHENRFCEDRMNVLSRNPDRIRALGSVLRVDSAFTDPELIGWVINELHGMKSARANAELERYLNEIDSLPENSSLKHGLASKRLQVRTVLEQHPR